MGLSSLLKVLKKIKGKKHRVGESIRKNKEKKQPLLSFLEALLLSKVISKQEIERFFFRDMSGLKDGLSKTSNQFESFGMTQNNRHSVSIVHDGSPSFNNITHCEVQDDALLLRDQTHLYSFAQQQKHTPS